MTGAIFSATVFLKDTGEIVSCTKHSCEADFKPTVLSNTLKAWGVEDHDLIDSDSQPDKHYVGIVGGELTIIDRPQIPYVIDKTSLVIGSGDYVTITGLHNPCTIVIDDPDPTVETVTHVVTGGGFEFEPETVGIYTIEINKFPFLPATITITALEPAGP